MADQFPTPIPVDERRAMMHVADDVWLEIAPGNPSYGAILHARHLVAVEICRLLGFKASPHARRGQSLYVVYLTRRSAARVRGAVEKLGVPGMSRAEPPEKK